MSLEQDFVNGICKGDVAFLRGFLDRHPEMLKMTLWWGDGYGYAMNCAAHFNQPQVVEFLAKEKGLNVNMRDAGLSTPLHDAKRRESYAAAAMLLLLGADPLLKDRQNNDTSVFCRSEEILAHLDPAYRERKIAGNWRRMSSKEVKHSYVIPEDGYRLTDIFNFETRQFRSIVESKNGNLTQTIRSFDEMPDKGVLYRAFEKLKALGGDAEKSVIDRPLPTPKRGLPPSDKPDGV